MNNESIKRLDSNPGAIVNTDNRGLKAYREARAKLTEEKKQFEQIKNDVSELKEIMSQILEKLNK